MLAAAIVVGQIVDQVIQPRLMGSIVGLQPAWLLIALPIGARVGAITGVGELLGLLLAVPVASCIKTLADAAKAGDLRPPESPPLLERFDHQRNGVGQVLLARIDFELGCFRAS